MFSFVAHPAEPFDLALAGESDACAKAGMRYLNFAINDRDVPAFAKAFLAQVTTAMKEGKARGALQGRYRQIRLVHGCVTCGQGMLPEEAFKQLSKARGLTVPGTPDRVAWVTSFVNSRTPLPF